MAITTNIKSTDAALLITQGIVAELKQDIYERLLTWVEPQLKGIAEDAARSVCRDALVHIDRNLATDQLNVMVQFKEHHEKKYKSTYTSD